MIQDTTLRMVVQAVDQASAPLANVKRNLDDVTGGLDSAKRAGEDALPAIGKEAEELSDQFNELGNSAGKAASLIGPAMVEAAVIAVVALVSLVKWVKESREEHQRLVEVSDRLDLPVRKIENYSEAWLGVAVALNEAARGFSNLNAAQKAAFAAIDVNPLSPGAGDTALTRVAAMSGSRSDKVDVLRILTGLTEEEAGKELDREVARLNKRLGNRAFGSTLAESEGVMMAGKVKTWDGYPAPRASDGSYETRLAITVTDPRLNGGKPTNIPSLWKGKELPEDAAVSNAIASGKSWRSFDSIEAAVNDAKRVSAELGRKIDAANTDAGALLRSGAVAPSAQLKEWEKGRKELEAVQKARIDGAADAQKEIDKIEKDTAQARLQAMREDYDIKAAFAQQGTKLVEDEAKRLSKTLADNDKEIASSSSDAWKTINEQVGRELKELKFPVNQFVEDWKDAMKDMVYYGDFSFKRLIAQVIVNITSRKLFDAIDKMGDALTNALSGTSKGGGFINGVKSFFGSLFGGNAGGGQESGLRWVGEEGPELVASGPNAMRVYNMRQLAAGASGGGGQTTKYYDHRTYNISGVETQQVIGYIEKTRREDQRANLRMLERNGLGSMR